MRTIIANNEYAAHFKEKAKRDIDNLVVDADYEVIIQKLRSSKTQEQLGYYWGVLIKELMNYSGYSKLECDQILKQECCIPHGFIYNNVSYVAYTSIAMMKVDEMSEYIDRCIEYLAEQDCIVPPPHYK